MKRKLNQLLLAILIAFAFGCSKDDSIQSKLTLEGKQVSQVFEDGQLTTRYTYKPNGLLDTVHFYSKFFASGLFATSEYNSDNLIASQEYYRNTSEGPIPTGSITFSYSNGMVVEYSSINEKNTFKYENGKCVEWSRYQDDILEEKKSFIYDQNGNIKEELKTDYDNGKLFVKIKIEYEYDSNHSPESYIYQLTPGFPTSQNNITLRNQTVIDSAPGTSFFVADSKYEYEYDLDGYPIKSIKSYMADGDWIQDTVTEYTYF